MRLAQPTALFATGLLALTGCGAERIDITGLELVELVEESLSGSAVAQARIAPGFRVVSSDLDGLSLWEPGGLQPRALGDSDGELLAAGVLPSGELILSLADGLAVQVDGVMLESPLQDALPGPVTQLLPWEDSLWIVAGGEVHRLRDDRISDFGVDGWSGAIALGAGSPPTLWLGTSEGVVGLASDGSGMVDSLDAATDVRRLAVDGAGHVWALEEEDLWMRSPDGVWQRFRLSAAVHSVAASPHAPGCWISTDDGLLHALGAEMRRATPVDDAVSEVDALGRLVLAGPSGLRRVGTSVALAVGGLVDDEVFSGSRELLLEPSRVGAWSELTASVDGEPLEVDPETGAVRVDTDRMEPGSRHTFSAAVSWPDGREARSVPLRFSVQRTGAITWAEDIEPLYAERCSICHGGSSETVLDSAELWAASFDRILSVTSTGEMPIGGTALDSGELDMLVTWADGGFQ